MKNIALRLKNNLTWGTIVYVLVAVIGFALSDGHATWVIEGISLVTLVAVTYVWRVVFVLKKGHSFQDLFLSASVIAMGYVALTSVVCLLPVTGERWEKIYFYIPWIVLRFPFWCLGLDPGTPALTWQECIPVIYLFGICFLANIKRFSVNDKKGIDNKSDDCRELF